MGAPGETAGIGFIRLARIGTSCVALDPLVWGFQSRDEMEAAFRTEREGSGGTVSDGAGGDCGAARGSRR
jgi:hypothetical protein